MAEKEIRFTENSTIRGREEHYLTVNIDVRKVLESWRTSLFSFEWLMPDGRIRSLPELPAEEQDKRAAVETLIEKGGALEMPILGIGIMENIEIGAGRAVFLTAAAHGVLILPAHIRRSHEKEFRSFLAA